MNITSPWMMFAPEIALISMILWHLMFELFGKTETKPFIRSAAAGCVLIFIILFLLWPYSGISLYGMFRLDAFSLLLKGLFLFSAVLTLLMVEQSEVLLGQRAKDFCLILLTALLGTFFLASTNDLISLFITIEWLTISLYVLTAFLKTDRFSLEAGTKYLVMGAFSSAIFLFGISLVYGFSHSIYFDGIKLAVLASGTNPLFVTGFFFILAGIGFKVAMFPFHLWAPDVYQGAPTPVTAFLSVASKTAGFAALLKFVFLISPGDLNWPFLLILLSVATLLFGNLAALHQTNIKRLFAYSSIAHVGYLLMGIACANAAGLRAALFYLVVYGIANSAAFLVITIAGRELESDEIADYQGFAKKSSFLSACLFLAFLSLGGIPPLAGFFAKFLILQSLISSGYMWVALLGAVNVIVSLYYYLSVVKEIYFRSADSKVELELEGSTKTILFFMAAALIFFGIFQQPLLDLVGPTVLNLLP